MNLTVQELADQFTKALPQVSPAPEPSAAAPAPTQSPVRISDYASQGYHLDVTVRPSDVVQAAKLLDRQGFALDTITGVDWMASGEMEIVYDYFHTERAFRVVVRCRVPRLQPELPTISEVYSGANWHERETHDFFGIRFLGHPNLEPFLLPEDATYHPLRKDFTA